MRYFKTFNPKAYRTYSDSGESKFYDNISPDGEPSDARPDHPDENHRLGSLVWEEITESDAAAIRDSWGPPASTSDAHKLACYDELVAACNNLVQIVEQLIPEESARGVANVVLFQARTAIAKAKGTP